MVFLYYYVFFSNIELTTHPIIPLNIGIADSIATYKESVNPKALHINSNNVAIS